jgi:hypothetical protein
MEEKVGYFVRSAGFKCQVWGFYPGTEKRAKVLVFLFLNVKIALDSD